MCDTPVSASHRHRFQIVPVRIVQLDLQRRLIEEETQSESADSATIEARIEARHFQRALRSQFGRHKPARCVSTERDRAESTMRVEREIDKFENSTPTRTVRRVAPRSPCSTRHRTRIR